MLHYVLLNLEILLQVKSNSDHTKSNRLNTQNQHWKELSRTIVINDYGNATKRDH